MTTTNISTPAPPARIPTGRWVVLAMFAFGTLATGGIWVYWKLHLAPFMPLQKALAAEFEKSSPRVDGGWSQSNDKQAPPLLRVVLRVPYEPEVGDVRVRQAIDHVVALTREHIDLSAYDTLEIYLVHYAPEKKPRQYEWRRKVAELSGE